MASIAIVVPLSGLPAHADAASISGTVTSNAKEPISGVEVIAMLPGQEDRFPIAQTGPDGRFTINDVPPGDYRILFDECPFYESRRCRSTYAWEFFDNAESWTEATVLTVAPGVHLDGIDASLALRPRPDLIVTDVGVEELTVYDTSVEDAVLGVTVEIRNGGTAATPSAEVFVFATTVSDGKSHLIERFEPELEPGQASSHRFAWRHERLAIGDVDLTALACEQDDSDLSNDSKTVRHHTLLASAGGYTVIGASSPPRCLRD